MSGDETNNCRSVIFYIRTGFAQEHRRVAASAGTYKAYDQYAARQDNAISHPLSGERGIRQIHDFGDRTSCHGGLLWPPLVISRVPCPATRAASLCRGAWPRPSTLLPDPQSRPGPNTVVREKPQQSWKSTSPVSTLGSSSSVASLTGMIDISEGHMFGVIDRKLAEMGTSLADAGSADRELPRLRS